jgi:predicted anti-sigma-YlaC factor YlaD
MNIIYGEVMRSARKLDQSVVAPTVLIDPPARPHKASQSDRIERRRSSRRQAQSKSSVRDDEFRYFLDRQGRQHFNFRQRVWLDSSVQMAYTRVYSIALKTLAVNLLTLVTPKRDYQAAVGLTSRRAVSLAPSFIRECLAGAPDEAWALPRTTIEAWLESRLRARAGPRSK